MWGTVPLLYTKVYQGRCNETSPPFVLTFCLTGTFLLVLVLFRPSIQHELHGTGDIEIWTPEDSLPVDDTTNLEPEGSCAFGSLPFTSSVENIYGNTSVTNTKTGITAAEEGTWQHGSQVTVYGSGSWECKVYLTNSPVTFHIHSGVVSAPPE